MRAQMFAKASASRGDEAAGSPYFLGVILAPRARGGARGCDPTGTHRRDARGPTRWG